MVRIDCYKEKCALVAYYFCGKKKRSVSPEHLFGIWKSWWKNDYVMENHLIYKILDGQLIHNKGDKDKDDKLLSQCNQTFQRSYRWIRDYIKEHDKKQAKEKVIRQRVRQLAELKSLAEGKNLKAYLHTRDVNCARLAHYQLVGDDGFRKDGNYEQLLHYLKNCKGDNKDDK